MSRREAGAYYTVEAALVMSAVLIFTGLLLTGIFYIHSRVVGNLILQETLERMLYTRGEAEEQAVTGEENARLRQFYGCSGSRIRAEKGILQVSGIAEQRGETEIRIPTYEPETVLRLYTALIPEKGGREDAGILQKRDELQLHDPGSGE